MYDFSYILYWISLIGFGCPSNPRSSFFFPMASALFTLYISAIPSSFGSILSTHSESKLYIEGVIMKSGRAIQGKNLRSRVSHWVLLVFLVGFHQVATRILVILGDFRHTGDLMEDLMTLLSGVFVGEDPRGVHSLKPSILEWRCQCFVNRTSKLIRLPRCSRKTMVASKRCEDLY